LMLSVISFLTYSYLRYFKVALSFPLTQFAKKDFLIKLAHIYVK